MLILKFVEMNQAKSHNAKRKRYAVVRRRRPKAKYTGYVAHQDKNKNGADVIGKLRGINAHYPLDHIVKHFYNRLDYVLEPVRHFTGFFDFPVGCYKKANQDNH